MELRDIFKVIGNRIWIFVLIVAVIGVGTYFYTLNQSNKYIGSLTIYTMVNPQEDSPLFYEYDNYYTFQASESLLDTISAWFKDPAYLTKIYATANEDLPNIKFKKYATLLSIKKNIPTSLVISISSPSEEYVRNILESAKIFSINNLSEWQEKGLIKNASISASDIFIVNEKPDIMLNLMLGIISGILIAVLFIFSLEYFKKR